MKVKDALHVAELQGGVIVKGHYYWAGNDPVAHGNHVHVAFDAPWGEPDAPTANPPNPCVGGAAVATAAAFAYRTAFEDHFGAGTYPWLGTCVRKHRNSDPGEPWSQHTFANAVDYGAAGVIGQQPIIDWLESEWIPPDTGEDDVLDPNWTRGYSEAWDAIVAGTQAADYYLDRNVGQLTNDGARARYIGRRQASLDWAATKKDTA